MKKTTKNSPLNIVILGLSITSSWGNGHATTYRSLVKELTAAKHSVTFLERDMPWYNDNRDMPVPPFGKTFLYNSFDELRERYSQIISTADLVIVGSFVPDGVKVGEWVNSTAVKTAFYDIDTPVTLQRLEQKVYDYISPELISSYDIYLSFTGGPILKLIEEQYGSPLARPLYCSVDPEIYYPEERSKIYDLGYIGTYSDDRQPVLDSLMLKAALTAEDKKFIVVGPMYPKEIQWPPNVERVYHLSPKEHNNFYNSQRFTLNITRSAMVNAGYSPSVRLFEAAACGIPIISDYWKGIEVFFEPGEEILISQSPADTLKYLYNTSETDAADVGFRAREKVLSRHTARHRAEELVNYYFESTELPKTAKKIYV